MRFVCSYFDEPICIDEGYVNSIVVENRNVFRRLVEDIAMQIDGLEGDSVLSEDNTLCSFAKKCELITEFAPFDINKKALLNNIVSTMEKTAVNEQFYIKTQELLAQIENYVYELAFDNEYDVECEKITISAVLKAIGIVWKDDYVNTLEKIIDYMELVNDFSYGKLFVTVNMRSYFSDEEINLFAKTVIEHGIKLLMIENMEYGMFENEKRLIIDKDMCII